MSLLRQIKQQDQLLPMLQSCQMSVEGLRTDMVDRFERLEARLCPGLESGRKRIDKENERANKPPLRPRMPSS
jgi:hypothetical protein